jgi:hypothetical protein
MSVRKKDMPQALRQGASEPLQRRACEKAPTLS